MASGFSCVVVVRGNEASVGSQQVRAEVDVSFKSTQHSSSMMICVYV